MTNYNDGEWHGWNGGECPVHPKTVVRAMTEMGRELNCKAKNIAWSQFNSGTDIIAFRVIKEHREPRDFWLTTRNGKYYSAESAATEYCDACGGEAIHVREVTE